jgi:hypothetical protein
VLCFEWRCETFVAGLSQQAGVAEGSLIRVVPGRAGAALTKPGRVQYCQMGRVRRAWRKGVREEPALLRPSILTPAQIWRIRAGRGASRCCRSGGNFRGGLHLPSRKAMLNGCGVGVARPLGVQPGSAASRGVVYEKTAPRSVSI